MMKPIAQLLTLLRLSYQEWRDDHASRLAAALAYYTLFSLAPLIVLVIAVTGLIWNRDIVQKHLLDQIQALVGPQGAQFVASMVANRGGQAQGILASVVGLIALIFGALGAFEALQSSLNAVWDVPEEKTHGFMEGVEKFIAERLVSFTMILGIGFLLLVSLVISTGLTAFETALGNFYPLSPVLTEIVNVVISIGVITVLFALMFKLLPQAKVAWKDVWWGALATAILFAVGKTAIGIYLGNSNIASAYGAAGSLVILLLWIYYSAQILFFGAELTQVYANKYGSKIVPETAEAAAQPAKRGAPVTRQGAGVPVTGHGTSAAPSAEVRRENRETVRVLSGLMAASFFAGLASAVAALRKRR